MTWTDTETNIMRDIFLLMKHNADVQDTEEYWCKLTDQVNTICTKYKGHDLAVAFCVASCLYYEEQLKATKEGTVS